MTISVVAIDDRRVAEVDYLTDHGEAGVCPRGNGDARTCGPIPLAVGDNAVLVRAVDGAANVSSMVLRVHRRAPTDDTPPTLEVIGVADGATVATSSVLLTAVATDDRGVASVSYATDHGAEGACGPPSGAAYPCGPIPLRLGATVVTVTARDAAGNEAADARTLHRQATPTLTVDPEAAVVVAGGGGATFTAELRNGSDPISWSLAGNGSISSATGAVTVYTPPASVDATETATLTASAGALSATATITIVNSPPTNPSDFGIELVFFDHAFPPSQSAAFQAAAARWAAVVVGDLVDVAYDRPPNGSCGRGEPAYFGTVDDVVIFVTTFSDAPGGLLGYAGPCLLRGPGADAGLPVAGYMAFDTFDLAALEANGALVPTIVHEMGHVLGIGTLWEGTPFFDLLEYVPVPATSDCSRASSFVVAPTFTGPNAVAAWRDLGGAGNVPVEDQGGAGTQCGHWDEAVFANELMTGWLNVGSANPLSGVTVGSMADVGYAIDPAAADPYDLPGLGGQAELGPIDVAARERLTRPIGFVDPATGDVTPIVRQDR